MMRLRVAIGGARLAAFAKEFRSRYRAEK